MSDNFSGLSRKNSDLIREFKLFAGMYMQSQGYSL